MPNQTASNVLAAIKREVTVGVAAAGGAGATQMRLINSPGLGLGRGTIASAERRRDQVAAMGRLGSKNVGGSFNFELSIGGFVDMLLESLVRGVWSAALVDAAVANVTTPTTSTIVRAAGSWLTTGFRVGDVITLTGDTTAANNNLRLRVTALTATTITVAGTPLTVDAVGRAITVTRLKKTMTPAVPIYHSYTVEQYDSDIDQSELFLGCRLTGFTLSLRPNGIVNCTATFMGMDRQVLTIAASPYFTDPSVSTGVALVADDSWIRYKGQDLTVITGLDLNFGIAAALQPVVGSLVSPDVFMNDLTISGSVSAIRQDLAALQDFDAETEFAIQVLLFEPETDPKDALGIYIPRVKVSGIDTPFLGGDAAKVETRNLYIGTHVGAAADDATAIVFHSSAA